MEYSFTPIKVIRKCGDKNHDNIKVFLNLWWCFTQEVYAKTELIFSAYAGNSVIFIIFILEWALNISKLHPSIAIGKYFAHLFPNHWYKKYTILKKVNGSLENN